jgi:hypothetical protein
MVEFQSKQRVPNRHKGGQIALRRSSSLHEQPQSKVGVPGRTCAVEILLCGSDRNLNAWRCRHGSQLKPMLAQIRNELFQFWWLANRSRINPAVSDRHYLDHVEAIEVLDRPVANGFAVPDTDGRA